MEFGLFLNGYLPGPAAHDPESEHTMLMREMDYAVLADSFNWKYVWLGEHHALTEYSHMSAPEVCFGYIAAQTEQIHLHDPHILAVVLVPLGHAAVGHGGILQGHDGIQSSLTDDHASGMLTEVTREPMDGLVKTDQGVKTRV